MLDFIVLGLVPGTDLRLGFDDVVRLSIILIAGLLVIWELYHYKYRKASLLARYIERISL